MLTIAATCPFDWRLVGNRLLRDRPQIVEDIDREKNHSEEVKRDKMFSKWNELKGSHATYRALMEVFDEVGNRQAAEMVKKLVSTLDKGRFCHGIMRAKPFYCVHKACKHN